MNDAVREERLRRWRLVLGRPGGSSSVSTGAAGPGGSTGAAGPAEDAGLSARDAGMDRALAAVYDAAPLVGQRRDAGLGTSAPAVTRWLGDIRTYFPAPLVRVLQQDALERLGLRRMLAEPELLEAIEPDIHLVGTLLSLRGALPEKTRQTARMVVRKVVEDIERRLAAELHRSVLGALDRAARNRRPRLGDVDWPATIRANLKHYQPDLRTIIAETLIGHARRRRIAALKDVILVVDQSGSMTTSVVYAGVMAASLASLRAVHTRLIVFDTSVVDLTDQLADPVDVLFGTRLGGGTDINQAVAYAQSLITRASDTIMVLITDLFEGGDQAGLVARIKSIIDSGVTLVVLLALSDDGAASYDHALAATCASLGAPAFACTPDHFPDLLACAIRREDLATWAARQDLQVAG
ncbi:MAG TPA: VWA domain-containing protein [Streptosporangiaceae bacterium]|nr:VWA domain-containing protein [Streptosporangiaceae bacterium]